MGGESGLNPLSSAESDKERAARMSKESTKAASGLAQQLATETAPIREELISDVLSFQQGGFDVTQSPVFQAGVSTIDPQAEAAREAVLATMPSGGLLQEGLTDVEIARAMQKGQLGAQVGSAMQDQAFTLATGIPSTVLSNLTAQAGTQAGLEAANIAAKAEIVSGVGQSAGMAAGAGGGKSSKKYKRNIAPLKIDSSLVNNLETVMFEYIDRPGIPQIGFIAEEVDKSLPEMVFRDSDGDPDGVYYQALPFVLLEEIKRLNKKIEILEKKINQ